MKKAANSRKRKGGVGVLRALCILLLLALLIGILLEEGRRSADTVSREMAVLSAHEITDTFSGYVFRDEVAIDSANNGPVAYNEAVADGAAVTSGTMLAQVFVDDTGTDKRQRAAVLYEEIARLERALAQSARPWQTDYTDAYATLMACVGQGDWQGGNEAALAMGQALERRSLLSDAAREEASLRIAELRATAAELVQYVDEPQALEAGEDGFFCRRTDGLEALFGVAAAATLTPESLQVLLSEANRSPNAVGKLVRAGAFCLALPVAPARAAAYLEGDVYRVRMLRGIEVDMQLTRIALSADGENALLILYAQQIPAGMDLSRRQTVQILRETVQGLRIPAAAVHSEGGNEFVYIVSEGVAVRRQITVLSRADGCCIVDASEGQGGLAGGDFVLVGTRSLYEGKVLE